MKSLKVCDPGPATASVGLRMKSGGRGASGRDGSVPGDVTAERELEAG